MHRSAVHGAREEAGETGVDAPCVVTTVERMEDVGCINGHWARDPQEVQKSHTQYWGHSKLGVTISGLEGHSVVVGGQDGVCVGRQWGIQCQKGGALASVPG